MAKENSNILSGPLLDFCVPEGSIGKYLFECLKKRDSQHVNIIDAITGQSLTTGDILKKSLKAAKVLENLGLQKGDVLAVVTENTTNYFMPLMGALYKGITAQLLNPLYSVGELKHALIISKPKLIVCSGLSIKNVVQANKELSFEDTKIVYLDNKADAHPDLDSFIDLAANIPFAEAESFTPEPIDSPDQAALILMSSGTTGLPKGVIISHQNIRASFDYYAHKEYVGTTINDGTVLVLPFFHVFGSVILILSISIGMKLILLPGFKPDTFLESVQKYKPTTLYIVPPLLLFIAKSPLVAKYDISSIKDIVVGGAPVGEKMHKEAINKIKNACVRLVYGATETTGGCTMHRYGKTEVGNVGVLVPNMLAKVRDCKTKQNLPPLGIGEICVKGPMVMKEYLGNDYSTKESFDEEGFYQTGDLGFYDELGSFFIVDRVKELIKYKGFQVPPAELEALILTHPSVKDCGVIGIPDERAGQVPLAFVVRQDGVEVTQEEVVNYVAERISVQKHLYGGVRFIQEIPKTASGKILRRKLLEIFNTDL